jgi:hypothetical protein
VISGINGGNCILSSMAKIRVEAGQIDGAEVLGNKGSYICYFRGKSAEWGGEQVVLSSSRQPYEPRVFKSVDGAIAELNRIGLTEILVKTINKQSS